MSLRSWKIRKLYVGQLWRAWLTKGCWVAWPRKGKDTRWLFILQVEAFNKLGRHPPTGEDEQHHTIRIHSRLSIILTSYRLIPCERNTPSNGPIQTWFFFGPKPVSWTTWGALTPILALLGPFKGVFGPRVGSGAPREPNFTNNQTNPFFLFHCPY